MKSTPALDHLTSAVRQEFARRVGDLEYRGFEASQTDGTAEFQRVRQCLDSVPPVRLGELVHELYHLPYGCEWPGRKESILAQAHRAAPRAGLGIGETEYVWMLVDQIRGRIQDTVIDQLDFYGDTDLGALLVEVYRMDEAAVTIRDPDNQFDFNVEDELPTESEFPHDYVSNLIQDIVAARLLKTVGRELLLEWINGSTAGVAG